MYDYNTSKPPLILKEYGRNIQKLVEYIKTVEDKEKRTRYAASLVELMKQVTPTLRDTVETTQKMWDDIYIMADFSIDIDGPFPIPPKEYLHKKPQRLSYKSNSLKFRHYGRNIELLAQKAMGMDDEAKREQAVIYMGKLMKSFHGSWNREVVDDSDILKNIRDLSNGQLNIDIDKVKAENLFDPLYKEKKKNHSGGQGGQGGGKGKSGGKSRGGNQQRRRKN
ncbi:MAG: DUF4290 domain-containing protein [Bacteroidota bacterium]